MGTILNGNFDLDAAMCVLVLVVRLWALNGVTAISCDHVVLPVNASSPLTIALIYKCPKLTAALNHDFSKVAMALSSTVAHY